MIEFDREMLDWFIGVVRKYMHLRGDYSQKELAEKVNTGISTLSRFLNQKTKDIDEQLVAKLVAFLNIPLHEIIDFISENSTDKFRKLVALYKEDLASDLGQGEVKDLKSEAFQKASAKIGNANVSYGTGSAHESFARGKGANEEGSEDTLANKFQRLSPRQKAYLSDFLDLDSDAKDLIVDVGNQLLRYFKQNRLSF